MIHQPHAHHVIYLVGSGITGWQEQNRLQGDTDLALSETGQTAAQHDAQLWMATRNGELVKTIHCAPDEASQRTAAIYAQLASAKVKPHLDLAEINLGLWQGLTVDELRERYRTAFAEFQADCACLTAPQGELPDQALNRLRLAVKRLAKRSDALVLVLRPVMLRLCTAWLTGEPEKRRLSEPLPAVQRFELDDDAWRSLRQTHAKRVLA